VLRFDHGKAAVAANIVASAPTVTEYRNVVFSIFISSSRTRQAYTGIYLDLRRSSFAAP
jgi:hypothetical protein